MPIDRITWTSRGGTCCCAVPVPTSRDTLAEILDWHITSTAVEEDEPVQATLNRLVAAGYTEAHLLAELGLSPWWRTERDTARRDAERARRRGQALRYDEQQLRRRAAHLAEQAGLASLDPAAVSVQVAATGRWGQVVAVGDGEGHDHVVLGRAWNSDRTDWEVSGDTGKDGWRLLTVSPTIGSAQGFVADVARSGPRS